jgi:hypothetical protein
LPGRGGAGLSCRGVALNHKAVSMGFFATWIAPARGVRRPRPPRWFTIGVDRSARQAHQGRPGSEFFTAPAGAARRRYKALQAHFVEGCSAAAFGYTTQAFESWCATSGRGDRDFDTWQQRCQTKLAGLLLAVPEVVALELPALIAAAGYPGTTVIPAVSSVLSLLALKLVGMRRVSHVDDLAERGGGGVAAGPAGWQTKEPMAPGASNTVASRVPFRSISAHSVFSGWNGVVSHSAVCRRRAKERCPGAA